MNPTDILAALTEPLMQLAQMPISIGDVLGFVSGIVCVWLTARANIWNFPVGILNCLILGLVFVQQRLFADASLQIVFIVMIVLGWRRWLSGKLTSEESPVFRSSLRDQLRLMTVAAILSVLIWQVLLWVKGSAPVLDASITALGLCAQWQLNRRQLESWLWWIAVDLISIPLFWSRDLPLISALYCLLLLISIRGWVRWRHLSTAAAAGVHA